MSEGKVQIRADGAVVFCNINDRTFATWEPEVAERIGRALIDAAKRAAEVKHAESIALDSAILMRLGAPLTLSNDRRIQDLARSEAVSNRKLRRYIPSIRSREIFGLPAIKQEAPWKT